MQSVQRIRASRLNWTRHRERGSLTSQMYADFDNGLWMVYGGREFTTSIAHNNFSGTNSGDTESPPRLLVSSYGYRIQSDLCTSVDGGLWMPNAGLIE